MISFIGSGDTTLELVAALRTVGYIPIPTRAGDPKALAYHDDGHRVYVDSDWIAGRGVAIRLGKQPDGSWLILIDLDAHTAEQCADRALLEIRRRVGDAFAYCLLKRSTSGDGYHLLLRTTEPIPNNQRIFVDGQHVGEAHCQGGHCPLVGAVLHGDITALRMLPAEAWATWRHVLTLQHGTRNPSSWTARAREMMAFVRQAHGIDTRRFRGADGMPRSFAGQRRRHLIAQAVWQRLQQARKGERSNAYANYIQSLMLLASDAYGLTADEKLRVVAALAMEDCPKAHEKGYDVTKDTAALLGRIVHGDPRANGSGYFRIPPWAQPYKHPARSRGRPKGQAAAHLVALRRLLLRHATSGRVEDITYRGDARPLTVGLIAHTLRLSTRSAQRYLRVLRDQHEICTEAVSGRQGRLIVSLLPHFGHAQSREMDGQKKDNTAPLNGHKG